MLKDPLYFYNCPNYISWLHNTLSVAIITSVLLAAVLFTSQTAKAQATSPRVSPQQAGKTISSNKPSQAISNPDVAAELNLGKELVCGSAAVLNGPSGLLVGSVCNSLVAKLNSNSQQQSQSGFINSPSKGTQPSSSKKSVGTSQPSSSKKSAGSFKPSTTSSPSKGTQPSSSKKSVGTSQPGSTSSLLQQQQPLCSDGLPPDANGNCPPHLCSDGLPPDANGSCPPPPSNNNQNQEQQQTEECPLGPMVPADCFPLPTNNSNPQPSENISPSKPGSNSNGGESSSDNVGSNSGNGNSDNSGNNNVGSSNSGEEENGNNPSSP